MKNKPKLTLFQKLFIILIFLSITVSAIQKEKEVLLVAGIPTEYIEEQISVTKGINQIVEDSNHIYILFDNSNDGIVQVYSQEGEYEKTIQCYSHINGRFQIAVHNHIFYLRDKEGSLYLYDDGKFLEFIDSRQAASLRKSIDFETNSPNYAIRFGSVWKIMDNGSKCIIERPGITTLYQNNRYPIFLILLVALSVFLQYRMSRKKEH